MGYSGQADQWVTRIRPALGGKNLEEEWDLDDEVRDTVRAAYRGFTLSLRNLEDLLHERGIEVSHETERFWWNRLGRLFAAEIRKRRVSGIRSSRWRSHLDEVFVKINCQQHYAFPPSWRRVQLHRKDGSQRPDLTAFERFGTYNRYPRHKTLDQQAKSTDCALIAMQLWERRVIGTSGATRCFPFSEKEAQCGPSPSCLSYWQALA